MNKIFFAAAMLALPAAAHAANTKICFEAEKPTSIASPLKKVTGKTGKISGGGFLEIPWDGNETKGKGQAGYRFNVKKAGTYTLWARTFWQNGCGNSILVSVNGGSPSVLGEDGTYNEWKWREGTRVKLKAGVNTLVLKNRETGVQVDQFFLCTDPDYTPTGVRKITQ
ncbi:MAG TPA: hypothetical protein VF681_01705 [Abditibacteriaceae bacterium]